MNIMDLLAGEVPEQETCKLTGADAIAALREGFRNYTTTHQFEPGDLIIQKDGVDGMVFAGERGGNPAIFIRYDAGVADQFNKPLPGCSYTHVAADCLIGKLHHTGGMIVLAAHSASFEPFVEPAD